MITKGQLREALAQAFEHLEKASVTMQDAQNDGAALRLENCFMEADKGVKAIKRLAEANLAA
jgi:hypothetical protein